MNKTVFHRAQLLMLVIALVFGQVGAGFLHNKHDAHGTVVDLNHTVLVPHGEHCKICSVDWVHQFLNEEFVFDFLREEHTSKVLAIVPSPATAALIVAKDRAPPVLG